MRTLLALLICGLGASAQDTFRSDDFAFSFDPPPGMTLLQPADLAALTGQPVEGFENRARSETPDGIVEHVYRWRDTSGRGRELSLTLTDIPPGEQLPFMSPDDFAMGIETSFGATVAPEDRSFLQRGGIVVGMRVDADRARADGAQVRQASAFYPLDEGDRFAFLWMSALVADWSDYEDQFKEVLESVAFPLPELARELAAQQQAERRQQAATGGNVQRPSEEEWASLPVSGSLLLAVLLLGWHFFGAGLKTP